MPLAAIASVIRQMPSAPTRSKSIRTVAASRWTPSPMTSRTASPRAACARQAATGPGARWCSGGMPLKTWVTRGRPPRGAPSSARPQRGPRGVGVGVGVAERREDAPGGEQPGQRVAAGPLRRVGHLGQRLRCARGLRGRGERVQQRRVDVGERGRVLRAPPRVRQERALEVDAGQVAGGDERGEGAHAVDQRRPAARDEAAEQGRRAVAVVVPGGAVVAPSASAPNSPPAPPWQCTSTAPGSRVRPGRPAVREGRPTARRRAPRGPARRSGSAPPRGRGRRRAGRPRG